MTDFISPVARLVQGSLVLEAKKTVDGKAALDAEGKQIYESFIAIAIAKTDPGLPAFYALYVATAREQFPHLFDANGNCLNNRFAWKIQDGDGVDSNGASVANKPGFAGHYIFKMATRFAPKCYHYGKYDVSQQIQNPNDIIKKGYFVRVSGKITGNGVGPQERSAVPGLFVSPDMVELIAFGPEIVTGPDPSKVFGAAPVNMAALPAGASATPLLPQGGPAIGGGPVGGLGPAPIPSGIGGGIGGGIGVPNAAVAQQAPLGVAAIGSPVAALPAGGNAGLAAMPGVGLGPAPVQQNIGPQFTMNPSAGGLTREQANAQGWSDEALINAGHMTRHW